MLNKAHQLMLDAAVPQRPTMGTRCTFKSCCCMCCGWSRAPAKRSSGRRRQAFFLSQQSVSSLYLWSMPTERCRVAHPRAAATVGLLKAGAASTGDQRAAVHAHGGCAPHGAPRLGGTAGLCRRVCRLHAGGRQWGACLRFASHLSAILTAALHNVDALATVRRVRRQAQRRFVCHQWLEGCS